MSLINALMLTGTILSAGEMVTSTFTNGRRKRLSRQQANLQLAKDKLDNEVVNLQSGIKYGMSAVRQKRNTDLAQQIQLKQKQSTALGRGITELETKKG